MESLHELEEKINNSFFYSLSKNKEFEAIVSHAIRYKSNGYDLFLLSLKNNINTFGASVIVVNKYRQLRDRYQVLRMDYVLSKSKDVIPFIKECIERSTLFKTVLL